MSKTKDGMIAVGVSGQKASLERLPGWETDSWAYHGDDGKAFGGESTGKNYGPTFSTNNVIGCGVNFSTGCIFFTKDGNFLGNAFRELKDLKVFPSVGMKKHAGAHIAANFGQSPFVFNINEMVAEEQRKIEMAINRTNTSSLHPLVDEDKFIQDLVAQFLAHDGYVETARAFAKDRRAQNTALTHINQEASQDVEVEDDIDAINRQRVRVAIMEGDIDKALKLTNAFYPHVLEESPQIVFRLKCRKFVELIRRYSDLQYKTSGKMGKASNRANGVSDVFEQDMELDDQTDSAAWDGMDTDDTDHLRMALLQEAMAYGQILQREYRDERREFKKALEDIFSLMAYDDAKASLHGHLLDSSGRVPVAEELNSAILVSLGKASSAALERVYQQCEALVDEISEDGGAGAFVNVENNFLG
ncbi:putative ran-binding protein [Phaeomoniella chlamydospora]|uniref:Putative ran-binding protein n=1 Tax=Phaeomoniella chlamydospora TaxID=158046 RepID=A0A0G2EIZ5_PHACM|nr:putative ran-binding protein [Phaeomoniella chlamydospora]